ncbi:MAG: type III-B CRISPR module-associated Cmr3 family protein, partial [Spirochaetia bacterium]|nr:hypothetical protein [Spirochaetota bacterium]MDW8113255.1 type III-B CRISPR module-associated Cmr3 family protein [Spirochaetia bacterium]
WLPDGVNESTLEGSICGVRVELIYCVIGKYQRIGGWDMEKREPKPMKKAVPVGSVYYFKVLDNNVNFKYILEKIHLKSLCKDELGKQGFGLCAVGVSV